MPASPAFNRLDPHPEVRVSQAAALAGIGHLLNRRIAVDMTKIIDWNVKQRDEAWLVFQGRPPSKAG